MHFYAFNIGDYTSHTAHLSPLEDIAYRRLLDLYYQTETPIQDDIKAICRQIRMREHADEVQVVLSEFFKLIDGVWVSVRCDRELEIYRMKGDASRENGKKGGRPRKPRTTQSEPVNNLLGFSGLENQNLDETQSEPEEKLNKKHETVNSNQETVKEDKSSSSAARLPDCPHLEILELYSKHLHMLTRVKAELWDGARAKSLAARWKFILSTKSAKTGKLYAEDRESGLDWFDRYFGYVAESDFLTGRDGRWQNCDLAWLVKAENFVKVLQGNYQNK